MKKIAIAYLRRSTDRQDKSIEDQRKTITTWGQAHGFDIVKSYIDDAISGVVTDDRKSFQQMIRDAREPGCKWNNVLVYDVKRFGRVDNDEAGYYRFLLRQVRIDVIYVAENFAGDDSDDLIRPVKQWQARQESKDLSKVTIRGQVTLAELGWWLGGTPPYGFDLIYFDSAGKPYMIVRFLEDGRKEVLAPDGHSQRILPKGESLTISKKDHSRLYPSKPERVAIVVRIFRMYMSGFGTFAIADRLNTEGLHSPRNEQWSSIYDGRWSASTIREILINPNYVGDSVWNRKTLGKFHRISKREAVARLAVDRNRIGYNPKEDWIIVPNTHASLIPREQFVQAEKLRDSRDERCGGASFRRGRAKHSPYLLSGLLRCGNCGRAFQGNTRTKGKRRKNGEPIRTSYYVCGGYVAKGTAVCKRILIRQERLDKAVLDQIVKCVSRFTNEGGQFILHREIEQSLGHSKAKGSDGEVADVRKRLAEIPRKADALLELITAANREFIDAKLVSLREERESLQARLAEAEAHKATTGRVDAVAADVLTILSEFENAFKKGPLEEQKALIRRFVQEIALDAEKGRAVVRIRKFPLPTSAGSGNAFRLVAGA